VFSPITHASKTQKINCKMNVEPINLEANMGMNVSIFIMEECFILLLKFMEDHFFS
jgi:hypothetical protein